ncbi:hypothetical protein F441_16478 [Phytophthora nicotianae CJ01A1]|uniref:Uncharacterized protein n=1 Tax=Phytophthora nicotianae CJ01A1 TaxID=1317063 RepID=W2W9I2_PHYNI|nr:hypothetical protein F441_16478 [Phytophthora nicotianae CJ01A1]
MSQKRRVSVVQFGRVKAVKVAVTEHVWVKTAQTALKLHQSIVLFRLVRNHRASDQA